MTYIHIAKSTGFGIDDSRRVEEKVGPRETIDGLLLEAAGTVGDQLCHVSVWQSKAHKDRYEAERLMPVFQSLGLAADAVASTEFTEYEADDLYMR